MEGKRFRVGSVAVLFAVVVLCVSIFCILTAVTAVADLRTAEQYGAHVTQMYTCQNRGEEWLAQADAYFAGMGDLPAQTEEQGNILSTVLTEGNVQLEIRAAKTRNGYVITRWECTTRWEPSQNWNLLQ